MVGHHDNVVKFVGACVDPTMMMAYLFQSGGSLETLICKKRLWSSANVDDVKQMIQIATDAALGLNHLHDRNILHCDIALRNLLLSEQNRAL